MKIIDRELLEKVESLLNLLLAYATGTPSDKGMIGDYRQLRETLIGDTRVEDKIPRFVRTCRDLPQFWAFIKQFDTYKARREYLREQFGPALDFLEGMQQAPADDSISAILTNFDSDHMRKIWQKALERRTEDPDGAITTARTLLESVCKKILDDSDTKYDDDADLPKLYHLTSLKLKLAPSQHTEQTMKRILGGCSSIVEGIGALRNRISDAHGQGASPIRPEQRHAELAVNLAGAMATFLVSSWEAEGSRFEPESNPF